MARETSEVIGLSKISNLGHFMGRMKIVTHINPLRTIRRCLRTMTKPLFCEKI